MPPVRVMHLVGATPWAEHVLRSGQGGASEITPVWRTPRKGLLSMVRQAVLRTVWIVDAGEGYPRLVTAYPD
jgi:hypothetical protein